MVTFPRVGARRAARLSAAVVACVGAPLAVVPSALAHHQAAGHAHHAAAHHRPAGACPNALASVASSPRGELRTAVTCLINEQRTEDHLPKLVANRRLDHSAQRWTDTMLSSNAFSHGSDFTSRISAAGFNWAAAAENIATGYRTPTAVVNAWMRSPGHCENILNPTYREVGTGVVSGFVRGASNRDGTWTQDFGRLMGQHAKSHDTAPERACTHR